MHYVIKKYDECFVTLRKDISVSEFFIIRLISSANIKLKGSQMFVKFGRGSVDVTVCVFLAVLVLVAINQPPSCAAVILALASQRMT